MRKDDIQHGYCHIASAERLGRQPRQQQPVGGLAASERRVDDRVDPAQDLSMCRSTPRNLSCENGEAEPHTCIG